MATVRRDPDSGIWWMWWKVKGEDGKWRARSKSLETGDKVTADEACAAYNKDQARMKRGLEPLYTAISQQTNWWPKFKKKALEHAATLTDHSEQKITFVLGVVEELFHPEKMTLTEFRAASIGANYVTKRLSGQPATRWCGTQKLVNRPVMASTVKTEISFLSPLFDRAIDEWEEIGITKNPFKKISVGNRPGVKQKKDDPKYMPFSTIQAFFAECRRRHGANGEFLGKLFYYMGPRISEAQAVRLQDVDTGARSIFFRGTKSGHAPRWVDIPDAFWPEVEALVSRARPGFLCPQTGGKMMPVSTIRHRFKKAFRAVGVPWAHPHTLRHCYVSHRLENGDNPVAVRDAAGHGNIATTNIYTHRGAGRQQVTLSPASQPAQAA